MYRLTLATNGDQKSLETEFSIAICRQTGDKWQSKTLFLDNLVAGFVFIKIVYNLLFHYVIVPFSPGVVGRL